MQLGSTGPWRTARGATAVGSEAEWTERSEARTSSRERLTVSDATRATFAAGTLVALAATNGSLYFSLGLGLTPYDLCWYQRILMYLFIMMLGVAAVEGRPDVWKTVLPLSLDSLALPAYHSYLQIAPGTTCAVDGPCASIQYSMLEDLLTIPRLAFIGFALVTVLVVAVARIGDKIDDTWGI